MKADGNNPDSEKEYQNRFDWRRKRQIENLEELTEVTHPGGADSIKQFGKLWGFKHDDPLYALQHSILTLWSEAAECFIFGNFQACIMTCGATVERALKYEYQKLKGTGLKGKWTLGKCIHELEGLIEPNVISWSKDILDPRNSRAHALLEHSDPFLAYWGGERGMYAVGANAYVIEYYRGDAKFVIQRTFQILNRLYSDSTSG